MSRVTPPVNKASQAFARHISSSQKVSRPSTLLLNSHERLSTSLPQRAQELNAGLLGRKLPLSGSQTELAERSHSSSTLAPHRPHLPTATTTFTKRPLMQGFQTSAPRPAAHDASTMDFMFFPSTAEDSQDFLSKIRVPLLPDAFDVDRSSGTGLEFETLDAALPTQEITVVAAHPELVLPSALTEVVGNDGFDSVDHVSVGMAREEAQSESGGFKDLWIGMVEDIFGQGKKQGGVKSA